MVGSDFILGRDLSGRRTRPTDRHGWRRIRDLDENTVIPSFELLRSSVPELANASLVPTVIDTGQNALVWDLGTHIVRFARHPGAMEDMKRESRVLEVLGPLLQIPTPRISLHEVAGVTVAVHPKLTGTPLESLTQLSDEEQTGVLDQIGSFLQTLHTIPLDVVGDLDVPIDDRSTWVTLLNRVRSEVYPSLESGPRQRFEALVAEFLAGIEELPQQLRHGDFGSGNILVGEGSVQGIIDFGGMSIGDPASDIAGLVASYGAGSINGVSRTYPTAPHLRNRAGFYLPAFAAMEALHGIDHQQEEALRAGLETLNALS